MWERHKDWRDPDYDPYRDDPVVQVFRVPDGPGFLCYTAPHLAGSSTLRRGLTDGGRLRTTPLSHSDDLGAPRLLQTEERPPPRPALCVLLLLRGCAVIVS